MRRRWRAVDEDRVARFGRRFDEKRGIEEILFRHLRERLGFL